MRLKIFVHPDGTQYWSEIAELPGCFASGGTLTELRAALAEAIGLYLWDAPAVIESRELSVGTNELEVCPNSEAGARREQWREDGHR